MINVKNKGNFNNINDFFVNVSNTIYMPKIRDIANETLKSLIFASPTVQIAQGWSYTITQVKKTISISFNNSVNDYGTNMVMIINDGHATPKGIWVPGKKFLDDPLNDCIKKIQNLIDGGQ